MGTKNRKRQWHNGPKQADGSAGASRWELSSDERGIALSIARGALECFLDGRAYALVNDLPAIFTWKGNVDATLWVDGVFRGSQIVTDLPLGDGIVSAVERASRDARFKPLAADELGALRIQLCVFPSERTEIDRRMLERDELSCERGYAIERGDRHGWFLPIVFNIIPVGKSGSLRSFLWELGMQKAGITEEDIFRRGTRMYLFDVQQFIEGSVPGHVHMLDGAVIERTFSGAEADERIRSAADWLFRMQEPDGNFVPIIDPLSGNRTQIDWVRTALAGWISAEFGVAAGADAHRAAAHSTAAFLRRYLVDEDLPVRYRPLALAYLGQLGNALGEKTIVDACIERIKNILPTLAYDPIVYAQIASFFSIATPAGDDASLSIALRLADRVQRDLDWHIETGKGVSLARYAELAHTFVSLYRRTGDERQLRLAGRVARWLVSHQMESGAFPMFINGGQPYVRGTGKVFEVLADLYSLAEDERGLFGDHADALDRALSWLLTMQYDDEALFFVRPELHASLVGGFRHDQGNPDAWIDAAGHIVLGAMRRSFPRAALRTGDAQTDRSAMTTHHPLADARGSLEQADAALRGGLFFRRRAVFDRTLTSAVRRAIAAIERLSGMRTGVLDLIEPDEILRNYGHAYEFLQRNGVLADKPFEAMLKYHAFPDTPGFFAMDPEVAYPPNVTDGNTASRRYAHGHSKQWPVVLGQAIGEVFERYPYSVYKLAELTKASVDTLRKQGRRFLDIGTLTRFSEAQCAAVPGRRWDDASEFHWEPVIRYSTGECVLAPAQTIYWNYLTNNEPRLRESNTSGLGGGASKERAILSGLYESVERDAFFLHWLNKVAPLRIDAATVPDGQFQALYRTSTAHGFEVSCLFAPTDIGIPVAFAVIHDPKPTGPCYVLGGGCNPDPARALYRALEEAWSIHYWSRSNFRGAYAELPADHVSFTTPIPIDRRVSAWSNHVMDGKLDFFLSGATVPFDAVCGTYPRAFTTAAEELQQAVAAVEALGAGYEVYAHLSEHPILRRAGYHAARVIVPKFMTMYYNEANAPLACPRVTEFGRTNGAAIVDGPNPLPHPFP